MEGDVKDIVLARLEKRLKDKDEEIRSLRERVHRIESEDPDRMKTLEDRVVHLEGELAETQIALSETLKKLGSFECLFNELLERFSEDDGLVDMADPDLSLDGQKDPREFQLYNQYVASGADQEIFVRERNNDGKEESKDALSFFRVSKSS
ncbi:MAG TPA: hypothetical protein VK436_06325 [Methanocella sp.]|nr:hypothetical protein [Methanocella sp.]